MCSAAPQVVSKRTPTVSGTRAVRGTRIGRPPASRTQIMARITEMLREREAGPLRLADLCEVTGISERTLRTIFLEEFGVGPKRYLRTRKMHAVRTALAAADPGRETVSGVARRFGLSDIGRMAKDYCALFGEYPRVTLMRKRRGGRRACDGKPAG
jgi:AraC family transcriptional regulator, ethanolamine operon transcriptional activator